jgi:hypothetical protein
MASEFFLALLHALSFKKNRQVEGWWILPWKVRHLIQMNTDNVLNLSREQLYQEQRAASLFCT